MTEQDSIVDVSFTIRGNSLPSDHGYALYGALSRALPELHGAEWLAVHPIRGPKRVDGAISVGRGSRLNVRVPVEYIPKLLPLAGQSLTIAGQTIWLGSPTVHALEPATSLDAKVVVIKITRPTKTERGLDKEALATRVRAEIARQLEAMSAKAEVRLTGRRELTVDGKRVVGFSVRLTGLDQVSSLAIQRGGLGGKRRMGCGVFVPTRTK